MARLRRLGKFITPAQRRCVLLIHRHGSAYRYWYGPAGYEWSWHIDGKPHTRAVESCWSNGLVHIEADRVTLTAVGEEVALQSIPVSR